MARLKQLEPKKETIGGLDFYIRPFPAMIAANLTGDLASLLTPVLAALMPLVGNDSNKDEGNGEDGDLLNMDVNDAAASISKSMEFFKFFVEQIWKLWRIRKQIRQRKERFNTL